MFPETYYFQKTLNPFFVNIKVKRSFIFKTDCGPAKFTFSNKEIWYLFNLQSIIDTSCD